MSMSAYVKTFRGRDHDDEVENEEDLDDDPLDGPDGGAGQGDLHQMMELGPPDAPPVARLRCGTTGNTARHIQCPTPGQQPRPRRPTTWSGA